jgi:hypothetical protein
MSRGGERRQRTPGARTRLRRREKARSTLLEDTSFTRSRGPCTSIATKLFNLARGRGGAVDSVSRSGKPAQAGGTGTEAEPSGRCAVHRVSPSSFSQEAMSCVMRRKGRRSRPSSLWRTRESGSGCSYVAVTVAEVGRRRLASNTLVRSAPKRVAVRVNGGLARRGHRSESSGDHIERKIAGESD